MIGIYLDCMKRWLDISSRAPRREYIYFVLARFIVLFAVLAVFSALLIPAGGAEPGAKPSLGTGGIIFAAVAGLYYVWEIVAGTTSTFRRMRDLNWPLWYVLGFFVPILGTVMAFCLVFLKSKPEPGAPEPFKKAS